MACCLEEGYSEGRAVIQNDDQLQRTGEALYHIEAALASLSRQKATIHPDRYALMVEPVLEHIHRLRAEIDQYIGLSDAEQVVAAAGRAKVGGPTGGAV
jgi:hypothetical protein